MNTEEFLAGGQQALDFIAEYYSSLGERPVVADVQPGYLRKLLPIEAPQTGEPFAAVLADVEKHILPGVSC